MSYRTWIMVLVVVVVLLVLGVGGGRSGVVGRGGATAGGRWWPW